MTLFKLVVLFYRLVVVLHNKILVFSFPNDCKCLFTFNTCDNPRGICELSSCDDDCQLLCFPAVKSGFMQCAVNIFNINANLLKFSLKLHYHSTQDISMAEDGASKSPRIFQAHKHEIACIAMDPSSYRLATASVEVIFPLRFNFIFVQSGF